MYLQNSHREMSPSLKPIQKQPPRGVPRKDLLKICNKFTGEHQRRNVISIKLQSNFIEIALRHGFSPVNLLQIFRTPFLENTSERLLLPIALFRYVQFFLKKYCFLYFTVFYFKILCILSLVIIIFDNFNLE